MTEKQQEIEANRASTHIDRLTGELLEVQCINTSIKTDWQFSSDNLVLGMLPEGK